MLYFALLRRYFNQQNVQSLVPSHFFPTGHKLCLAPSCPSLAGPIDANLVQPHNLLPWFFSADHRKTNLQWNAWSYHANEGGVID